MPIIKKSSGHGGSRPGAGRKPKGHQSPTALAEIDVSAARAAPIPGDIADVALQYARSVLASLVSIAVGGVGDQARVAAANAILDRGYGRPAVDAGGSAMLPFPGMGRRPPVAAEIRAEARRNATIAIEVLFRIAINSDAERARVAAAKSLLDRGLGTAGTAEVPDELGRRLGKRDQAIEDANEAASGIFAPPKGPKDKLQ